MKGLKFFKFDIAKIEDDEIKISFDVKFLKGVDQIVEAFNAGKAMIEGKFVDGALGVINLFSTIYSWIKAGKK